MKTIKYDGPVSVIKADTVYECLACGKEYTEDRVHAHEDACEKIPAYLQSREDRKEWAHRQCDLEQLELI